MKVYGVIYLLIDGTNDMEYVGQTTRSVEERFYQHAKCKTSYIGRAIQAHGANMFVVAILKECYSKAELDYWEKHFIKYRDTKSPNGYNLTDGGDGGSGYSPSDETRAKLRVAMNGENNPFFGKRHTAESLAKMTESHLGNTAWVGRHHRKDSKVIISVARRTDCPFKNLWAEMDKRQLTYKDLADILEMPHTTLPEKMRGIKRFTAIEVIKLAKFFGLPAEYLFERNDAIPFSMYRDSPFKNLLIELDNRKINYKEIAEILGFKSASVSEKMLGRKNFTAKDIANLVKFFGKPTEYLFERDDGLPAIMTEAEKSSKRSKEHRCYRLYKNLLSEMDNRYISYGALAEILGLSRFTVADKIRGKTRFTAKDIAKLVEFFGKPAEYLMARDDGK